MAALRPQPRFPEPDTQPFWDATKRRELTYQTCDRCGAVVFYPRRHCPECGSTDTTWNVSRGEGTVYTFSVIMQSRHPAFADLGPYAVAYVDLDEGFRIMSNIVGVEDPVRDVRCGMRVRLRWEDQGSDEVALPMFEPA
ncbi:MAG: Zn-ribbon domain-containing OB-fold protein [Candidatus Tectomicrobia bacterium]|nr:Zn-ribbon domain-containing OB-fold protein [Candidatus Tectomicrobia bacterium]